MVSRSPVRDIGGREDDERERPGVELAGDDRSERQERIYRGRENGRRRGPGAHRFEQHGRRRGRAARERHRENASRRVRTRQGMPPVNDLARATIVPAPERKRLRADQRLAFRAPPTKDPAPD